MNRKLRSAMLLALCLCVSLSARAQIFPDKPVHLIVGAGAGSFPDQVARRLAESLSEQWGQPIVIDNRPGAGGIAAMGGFAKAPADGYTLALATMSQLVFNPHLFQGLPYDVLRDVQPVGTVRSGSMMIVAHPGFSARSLGDLVSIAQRKPGDIDFAVPANGSPPHVVLGMLMAITHTSFSVVPYKTGADAVVQVASGQVPLFIDAVPILAGLVQSGKLRALAVTGRTRVTQFPDVRTVAEQGYPGFNGEALMGLVARPGTPDAALKRLSTGLANAVNSDALRQFFESSGARAQTTTPEEFAALIRNDSDHWGRVIRDMHLVLDH
ncbi:MAG: tripartite tricarboxylate transporter substrate binding protein [Burkholderiales bacterium]|nr:tripartite tricarboxylate transporter substrate binding protein [Burkholderiales bacterium]